MKNLGNYYKMCKKCETTPVYEFTNKRKLCGDCFIKYFQKKVLYTIRRFGLIKKNEIIGYEKGDDFRQVVLESILKLFAEKWRIKLVELHSQARDINKQLIINKKISKIAIGQTIDLTAYKIINSLVNKNVKNLEDVAPIEGKIIKPLYLFLDKEILLYAKLRSNFCIPKGMRQHYAKLKKLKLTKIEKEKNELSEFIEELEKKHPEVKRAVVNSYLELFPSPSPEKDTINRI